MNAEVELNKTCEEWQRLAGIEGEAICRRDWQLVFDCQDALRKLQPRLLRCNESPDGKRNFQMAVSNLIEIERRNLELLNVLRQRAAMQREQLEQSHKNLRRIQRSYVRSRNADWSTFS